MKTIWLIIFFLSMTGCATRRPLMEDCVFIGHGQKGHNSLWECQRAIE